MHHYLNHALAELVDLDGGQWLSLVASVVATAVSVAVTIHYGRKNG